MSNEITSRQGLLNTSVVQHLGRCSDSFAGSCCLYHRLAHYRLVSAHHRQSQITRINQRFVLGAVLYSLSRRFEFINIDKANLSHDAIFGYTWHV